MHSVPQFPIRSHCDFMAFIWKCTFDSILCAAAPSKGTRVDFTSGCWRCPDIKLGAWLAGLWKSGGGIFSAEIPREAFSRRQLPRIKGPSQSWIRLRSTWSGFLSMWYMLGPLTGFFFFSVKEADLLKCFLFPCQRLTEAWKWYSSSCRMRTLKRWLGGYFGGAPGHPEVALGAPSLRF